MLNVQCPECDSFDVITRLTPHSFSYGAGTNRVEITCYLPVRICSTCNCESVDDEGERIRHEAVCNHLGRLSPAEIQSVREREGTQAAFAELTGIGEASLSRWETGASLQSKAFDNYLALLQFNENILRLKTRATRTRKVAPHHEQFRVIDITPKRLMQQGKFILRPTV